MVYYKNYHELVITPWLDNIVWPKNPINSSFLFLILPIPFLYKCLAYAYFQLVPSVANRRIYSIGPATFFIIPKTFCSNLLIIIYIIYNRNDFFNWVNYLYYDQLNSMIINYCSLSLFWVRKNIENIYLRNLTVVINFIFFFHQSEWFLLFILGAFELVRNLFIYRLPKVLNSVVETYQQSPNMMNQRIETLCKNIWTAASSREDIHIFELVGNFIQGQNVSPLTDQARRELKIFVHEIPNFKFLKVQSIWTIFVPQGMLLLSSSRARFISSSSFNFIDQDNIMSALGPLERNEICGICHDSWNPPVLRFNCQHLYCAECICQWLINNNFCPYCRRDI